jgi:hypothetical protein
MEALGFDDVDYEPDELGVSPVPAGLEGVVGLTLVPEQDDVTELEAGQDAETTPTAILGPDNEVAKLDLPLDDTSDMNALNQLLHDISKTPLLTKVEEI